MVGLFQTRERRALVVFLLLAGVFVAGLLLAERRKSAVSVLSGHLRGRTNTMPLYIELLYQGYDFTGAFAVSAILVLMAVIILVLRSVLEYKGQQAAKAEKGQQEG